MHTKFIGFKEFRMNLTKIADEANKGTRYIVLNKNTPVLDVKGINDKDISLEKLVDDVATARDQVKKGKVYTQQEIMDEFGIS
jgi:hypothetical protein